MRRRQAPRHIAMAVRRDPTAPGRARGGSLPAGGVGAELRSRSSQFAEKLCVKEDRAFRSLCRERRDVARLGPRCSGLTPGERRRKAQESGCVRREGTHWFVASLRGLAFIQYTVGTHLRH